MCRCRHAEYLLLCMRIRNCVRCVHANIQQCDFNLLVITHSTMHTMTLHHYKGVSIRLYTLKLVFSLSFSYTSKYSSFLFAITAFLIRRMQSVVLLQCFRFLCFECHQLFISKVRRQFILKIAFQRDSIQKLNF